MERLWNVWQKIEASDTLAIPCDKSRNVVGRSWPMHIRYEAATNWNGSLACFMDLFNKPDFARARRRIDTRRLSDANHRRCVAHSQLRIKGRNESMIRITPVPAIRSKTTNCRDEPYRSLVSVREPCGDALSSNETSFSAASGVCAPWPITIS